MPDIADRLKKIEVWQIKKSIAENAAALAEEERKANCEKEIIGLWDRAKAMIDLYNAGVKAGLPFPSNSHGNGYTCRTFEANRVQNKMGFGVYGRTTMHPGDYANSIGIYDDPEWYQIDLHDGTLDYRGSRAWSKLDYFVSLFNEFEQFFYDTLDNILARYD